MKINSLIFVIGFILAFAGGYFIFDSSGSAETTDSASTEVQETTDSESASPDEQAGDTEGATESAEGDVVTAEAEVLSANNCLSCHAVESLGAAGGTTGPDLSNAFTEVEGKHGKDLDSFLQEPTSAVMSTVIGDNPLSDEEREKIVEALKAASEK